MKVFFFPEVQEAAKLAEVCGVWCGGRAESVGQSVRRLTGICGGPYREQRGSSSEGAGFGPAGLRTVRFNFKPQLCEARPAAVLGAALGCVPRHGATRPISAVTPSHVAVLLVRTRTYRPVCLLYSV